jgi:hypothetical protein
MKVHIQNPDSNMAALKRMTESHIRKFATDMSVQLYHSGPNKQNQNRRGSAVAEIFLYQAREGLGWRFHGDSKLPSLIRAAESVLAFAGSYGH